MTKPGEGVRVGSCVFQTTTGALTEGQGKGAALRPQATQVLAVMAARNGEVVATPDEGLPDGIGCDMNGILWSGAENGIQIFAPHRTLKGKILEPKRVSHLACGGPRRNRLFIGATTSVHLVGVGAAGAEAPRRSRADAHSA